MCFVQYYTQNELIIDYAPIYLYKAVIRLKFKVPIWLTAINLQIWGLDGTGVLPIQPYHTNHIVQLWCAALMKHTAASGLSSKPVEHILNQLQLVLDTGYPRVFRINFVFVE